MAKGCFTGIGVGPGDPELLTLKAVKALAGADVVIAPRTEKREDSLALSIAKPHLRPDIEVLELVFPMVSQPEALSEAWLNNRRIIHQRLDAGQQVVFLTLGDPMFYSTYIYVFELLKGSGHIVETIPGIPAFCAIASHHGMPVVEGDDILSVVPATVAPEKMAQVFAVSDRLVVMKISRNFAQLRGTMQKYGFAEQALMVAKCGQPGETVQTDFLAVNSQDVTYLSTILARKNKKRMMKKALLVVSFGTTVTATRRANIDALETTLAEEFPEYELRRSFTSAIVREKMLAEEGIWTDSPDIALQRLADAGFDEVLIQPTHIIPGEEYDRLRSSIRPFATAGTFGILKMGRPLLYHEGKKTGESDDYQLVVAALQDQLPTNGKRTILMGHGSGHLADRCYDILQERFSAAGLTVFVATVEGSRTFEAALQWLRTEKVDSVNLMPFMLVAGDHAMNDMAGVAEDSWKSRLEFAGYAVEVCLRGLGENAAIRRIYLEHLRAAHCFAD